MLEVWQLERCKLRAEPDQSVNSNVGHTVRLVLYGVRDRQPLELRASPCQCEQRCICELAGVEIHRFELATALCDGTDSKVAHSKLETSVPTFD